MKPILKWQYLQIVKELLLLQDHEADKACPCETGGEKCIRKHLLSIEAYAQETIPIEENETYRKKLYSLADEAKMHRLEEEKALCGIKNSPDLTMWCRDWRKQFEDYSLTCEDLKKEDKGKNGKKKNSQPCF
ncbi:hypothetical protein CHISP_3420 [Chitinispirillum alkaliphilum]|nr:hypothetical protein CHISP_3420 [Chitinispirillum alkaliphilum]